MNPFKTIINKITKVFTKDSKRKYIYRKEITPVGVPTWDGREMVVTETNPTSYDAIIQPRSEVIEPSPEDTIETICTRMSQAAIDMEFERIIVYPIDGELRAGVLRTLRDQEYAKITQRLSLTDQLPHEIIGLAFEEAKKHRAFRKTKEEWIDPPKYPMYEYAEAGLIGKDDLNSKTIIYRYRRNTGSRYSMSPGFEKPKEN